VSIRTDPLDELAIPDGTTVEEHDLVTDGDVIVGGQSTVEFGVRGNNVIAGERVEFGGHIEAEEDCRLDMWSDVAEDVLVGRDAYLGERVHVGGELKVAGDLDIGDDVDIEDGFEANGWIVIRNPMPTIVFLVVYLSQLLRIGEEEAAEQLASQLVDAHDREDQPVVLPRGARVGDDSWRVSTPATIGDDCRLHGNIRAASLDVGAGTTVFGSLRAREGVTVGEGTEIKGDVTTRSGTARVEADAHVWGDISATDVELHEHAVVEGTIRVDGELTQIRDAMPDTDDADGAAETNGDRDAADPPESDATSDSETAGQTAPDSETAGQTAPDSETAGQTAPDSETGRDATAEAETAADVEAPTDEAGGDSVERDEQPTADDQTDEGVNPADDVCTDPDPVPEPDLFTGGLDGASADVDADADADVVDSLVDEATGDTRTNGHDEDAEVAEVE